jgi:hypothetical protein
VVTVTGEAELWPALSSVPTSVQGEGSGTEWRGKLVSTDFGSPPPQEILHLPQECVFLPGALGRTGVCTRVASVSLSASHTPSSPCHPKEHALYDF